MNTIFILYLVVWGRVDGLKCIADAYEIQADAKGIRLVADIAAREIDMTDPHNEVTLRLVNKATGDGEDLGSVIMDRPYRCRKIQPVLNTLERLTVTLADAVARTEDRIKADAEDQARAIRGTGETFEASDVPMVLVHETTLRPIHKGAQVETGDGDFCTLEGGAAPHKPSSTGRVYVRYPGAEYTRSFFPSVIGCEWRPIE